MVITQLCQKPAKQPAFDPISFITRFCICSCIDKFSSHFTGEGNQQNNNLQARFFYNVVLYCLTDLPIAIVYLYLQVFSFLEYFPQTNVFA